MKFYLAGGWHLLRVEVNGRPEWIICDPMGDRLGDTDKHKCELDVALLAKLGSSIVGQPPINHEEG